jgi:hypothetical protein
LPTLKRSGESNKEKLKAQAQPSALSTADLLRRLAKGNRGQTKYRTKNKNDPDNFNYYQDIKQSESSSSKLTMRSGTQLVKSC